jgi:hypothetical protein
MDLGHGGGPVGWVSGRRKKRHSRNPKTRPPQQKDFPFSHVERAEICFPLGAARRRDKPFPVARHRASA